MLAEVLHCSFSLFVKSRLFHFQFRFSAFFCLFVFFVVVFLSVFQGGAWGWGGGKKGWSCSVFRRRRSPVVAHNECNVVERYVVWNVSEGVSFSFKKVCQCNAQSEEEEEEEEGGQNKTKNKNMGQWKKRRSRRSVAGQMRWWEFQEAALVTTWRADLETSSYCVGFFKSSLSFSTWWLTSGLPHVSPKKRFS